jgi:hypothetical protein
MLRPVEGSHRDQPQRSRGSHRALGAGGVPLAWGVVPGVVVGGPGAVLVWPGGVRVCPGAVVVGLGVVGEGAGDARPRPGIVLARPGVVAGAFRARGSVFAGDGAVPDRSRDGSGTVVTGARPARCCGVRLAAADCTRSGSAGGAAPSVPRSPTIGMPASGCSPSPPRISTSSHSPKAIVARRPAVARRRRRRPVGSTRTWWLRTAGGSGSSTALQDISSAAGVGSSSYLRASRSSAVICRGHETWKPKSVSPLLLHAHP